MVGFTAAFAVLSTSYIRRKVKRPTKGLTADAYAWRAWCFAWNATPGRYTLYVRATDAEGNTQPVEQHWNFQGMGNNMAQRVDVIVE